MVEPEGAKRRSSMTFPIEYKSPPSGYGKKRKTGLKKRRESGGRNDGIRSSRKNSKRGTIWIPRVRHNYVPLRPHSYTVNTYTPSVKTIPFVCGQSISKTHNIGLKIQETLNAIKQEKAKNNPLYKYQFPRVYSSTNNSMSQNPDGSSKPSLHIRQPPMSKRKPVDMNLLKTVFLELYEDLTKLMEDLQEIRNNHNQKTPDGIKMADSLEQTIKKKEVQISVTMALYKEVMCLRKALGIKSDKAFRTKYLSIQDETPKRNIIYKNMKEFQGGDH